MRRGIACSLSNCIVGFHRSSKAIKIIRPETLVRWHRPGFPRRRQSKSRADIDEAEAVRSDGTSSLVERTVTQNLGSRRMLPLRAHQICVASPQPIRTAAASAEAGRMTRAATAIPDVADRKTTAAQISMTGREEGAERIPWRSHPTTTAPAERLSVRPTNSSRSRSPATQMTRRLSAACARMAILPAPGRSAERRRGPSSRNARPTQQHRRSRSDQR